MKLSPLIFSVVACALVWVDVEGRCRKRIVKYIHPAPVSVPTPNFNLQSSLEDDTPVKGVSYTRIPPNTNQRPNLSCLLFSDDGCEASCKLECDINGCYQSDGFCSQKIYCTCNEIYLVKNQPVTADQFRKLTFEDLWNYKFKPTNNTANLKNRIFQSDELYGFIVPFLQNPHKSGRNVREALLKRYPKLSSAQNLQPREHGVKAELFGDGAGTGGENLHRYIQNTMNSIEQNSVYDRLSHTRYMRRLIYLIKDINNEEDLSYILRQIRRTGNNRLFERLRRYLMKRGYYFDDDLRPISKKARCCMKKKMKCGCKCKLKSKLKRFSRGNGATSFYQDDDDSDWVEAEGEDELIEMALIEELFDSNDSEARYPSNIIVDEQPVSNTNYPITLEEPVPSIQDTTTINPSRLEDIDEVMPQKFNEDQTIAPSDTQHAITNNSAGLEYPTVTSEQPIVFSQKSNYPEYGRFFSSSNKNHLPDKPIPEFYTNTLANYGNQQLPSSPMTPETVFYEEYAQPNNGVLDNSHFPSTPFANFQYFDAPDSATYQYSEPFDETAVTPAQKLDEYTKPAIAVQNPEKSSESIILSSKLTPQNPVQPPQNPVTQPETLEHPSKLPIKLRKIEQNLEPIIPPTQDLKTSSTPLATPQTTQPILPSAAIPIKDLENPSKLSTASQGLDNLTPKITPNLTSSLQSVSSPLAVEKSSQNITSPSKNILQQFVTEKPSPKITDSSPYLNEFSALSDINTFEIPDAAPSVESLFAKHNPSSEKTSITTMPSFPVPSSSSSSSTPPNSPTILNNAEAYSIQTIPTKITEPESPFPINLQSYHIQSTPVMQKPKDKVYYQVLMDENGNIIKSANYKYPGQPQHSQNTQQFASVSPPQHSSTTYQDDLPLFDKFNKQKILDAAKSNPGQSMVFDNDLNTADDVPIFDIPSDIDMLSGTIGVFPEGVVEEHDDTGGDTWETMPKSHYTNDGAYEYETPNNIEMMNHQGPTPAGSQYAYKINGDGKSDIPINFEIITPTKDRPGYSQYSFEIDRDNNRIQTNDGLSLDFEENNPGRAHNWSAYSVNDSDNVAKFPINSIDGTSIVGKNPSIISNSNQIIHHNSNSNEGGLLDIDIFDASDEPGRNILARKIGLDNATQQNQIFYNTISSNENDGIDAAEDIVPKYKSFKSGSDKVVETNSQSSTKMASNNNYSIPIKSTDHFINNTLKDTEDNSANCDILIDPEDDTMNF